MTTQTNSTTYLEVENEKVLRFRFRSDLATNRRAAAELRRRADALDATFTDPLNPEFDMLDAHGEIDYAKIERTRQLVDSRMHASEIDAYKRARLIRHIVVTGDSLWHALWVLNGSRDGEGCDCGRDECKAIRTKVGR